MSTEDLPSIDPEESPEVQREKLREATQAKKKQVDAKQEAALEEIRSGETVTSYETVTLGELDFEVKAWIDGETMDAIQYAQELAESEESVLDSIRIMRGVLSDMTTDDTYNEAFWRAYYDEYGVAGLEEAMSVVLSPARERQEEKREGVRSFRQGE